MEKYKNKTKIINLNYQVYHGMKSLNYLMDHSLYQVFKNFSGTSSEKQQLLIILQ